MELERPAAAQRQEEGRKKGGEKAGRGRPAEQVSSNLGETNGASEGRTARVAAAPTGYSASTLAKVATIRQAAEAEPEKFGDLYGETQKPGAKVDPIHKELKKRAAFLFFSVFASICFSISFQGTAAICWAREDCFCVISSGTVSGNGNVVLLFFLVCLPPLAIDRLPIDLLFDLLPGHAGHLFGAGELRLRHLYRHRSL